eukprot:9502162-Pyramimonas_sp.AAC.1
MRRRRLTLGSHRPAAEAARQGEDRGQRQGQRPEGDEPRGSVGKDSVQGSVLPVPPQEYDSKI